MEIVTLREDYFCSNTYVVVDRDEAIIIDAGVSLETIKNAIKKYDGLKVKAILLTHAHFDHILALEDYINYFNCKVYIYKSGISNLSNPVNNYSQFTERIIKVESDNIINLPQKEKFNIGRFKVQYLYTPGHTDDSVCYILDDVMFTGDTIFDGLIGRTDLANSSEIDMQKSLVKLLKAPVCQMYFPGHGRKSYGQNMQDYLKLLNGVITE